MPDDDPLFASRLTSVVELLDSVLAQREQQVISALLSKYRSGKLQPHEAFGWVGQLNEIHGLRRKAHADLRDELSEVRDPHG